MNIAYKNITHYDISKGLKENNTVIVKGNINMAYDAKLEIIAK